MVRRAGRLCPVRGSDAARLARRLLPSEARPSGRVVTGLVRAARIAAIRLVPPVLPNAAVPRPDRLSPGRESAAAEQTRVAGAVASRTSRAGAVARHRDFQQAQAAPVADFQPTDRASEMLASPAKRRDRAAAAVATAAAMTAPAGTALAFDRARDLVSGVSPLLRFGRAPASAHRTTARIATVDREPARARLDWARARPKLETGDEAPPAAVQFAAVPLQAQRQTNVAPDRPAHPALHWALWARMACRTSAPEKTAARGQDPGDEAVPEIPVVERARAPMAERRASDRAARITDAAAYPS